MIRNKRKEEQKMFPIFNEMLKQLVELIPAILGLYFLFDMIGSLLFGKR